MARATTKEPRSKIIKRDAPKGPEDDVDYQITKMDRYEDFFVAIIHVMETGDDVTVHNRYGSWFIGDPAEKAGHMREINHSVCFKLQERKAITEKETPVDPDNPFMNLPVAAPVIDPNNPFMNL